MAVETECCWCGVRFKAQRSTAKYCSNDCRQAAFQERKRERDPILVSTLPEVKGGVSVDELVAAINQLRYVTTTFEAGALCSPPRYRNLCRSVADDLQKALRKVGQ